MPTRARRIAHLVVSVLLSIAVVSPVSAQATVGLILHDEASYDGYTLFAPIPALNTYLIDNEGKLVHSWASTFRPGLSVYLTETGNLLRTGQYAPGGSSRYLTTFGLMPAFSIISSVFQDLEQRGLW